MAKETILIIEDDSDIVELVRYNLERERYEVRDAVTGEEGLDLAVSLKPSLILLDLGLPGIQGLEVCRVLRQRMDTKTIPVIMLTARDDDADIVRGWTTGVDFYLTKPFELDELLLVVRRALEATDTGNSDDASTDKPAP